MLYDKKSYDLPKGHLNEGESYLEAAVRETYEESSVSELAFPWGEIFYDTQMFFELIQFSTFARVVLYKFNSYSKIIRFLQ